MEPTNQLLAKQEARKAYRDALIRYEMARRASETLAQLRLELGADLAKEAQQRYERNRIIAQLENARRHLATPGIDQEVFIGTAEDIFIRRT